MSWKRYYDTALIVVFALVCWVFYQFWYPYHFFFQEQNQIFLLSRDYVYGYFGKAGGLTELVGDFLIQLFYFLYVGAAVLTVCLAAIGLLADRALKNLGIGKVAALVVALLVMAYAANGHLNATYRLPSTLSILGWTAVLWGVSKVKGWKWRAAVSCLLSPVAYLVFGSPDFRDLQKPNFGLEDTLAADCEYYFGNYDKVIKRVESKQKWTKEEVFYYNLVQAQRDQLPEHLLSFFPNNLGTLTHIGPNSTALTRRIQNELYWVLGDMTFTERAAMMANVGSYDNRNVRMIRRLAECNIVSGDSIAAEKHLRILDKTLVHRERARWLREYGKTAFQNKMALVNNHDTITTSDNSRFLMTQLLDAHPDNTVALDYLLCTELLIKDLTDFKYDYDRYCMATGHPRLKVLYQEALCIWLASKQAPPEVWRQYVRMPDVMQRFSDYNEHRGDIRFKDTYWYYFDKIKAPELGK